MSPLIIIIGLVGAIVIFINPFLGLLAIVGLMPQALVHTISNMLFGVFTSITPIKIIGGLTFLAVLLRSVTERKNLDFLKKRQVKFFMFFLVWIFISGFTQPCSFTRENFTYFASFAMLGFVILSLVTDLRKFRWVLWMSLISMFIVSLQSIVNYSSYSVTMRMQGASYGPNYFAIILLPFVAISFYSIFTEKKLFKFLSLLCAVVIASALILTFSRGGLIGFFGMLLVATLTAKRKVKSLLFVIVCLIILISIAPSQLWQRLSMTKLQSETRDVTVHSTQDRLLHFKAAWRMFLANPLFGVGIGDYYWKCRDYAPVYPRRAHTMYLEIMAELGIIGIFLFLGILFHTYKSLRKIMSSDSNLSCYARGLFIGLSGFLISALFLHAQQERVLWFVIFMSAALDIIYAKQLSNQRDKKGRRGKKFKRVKELDEFDEPANSTSYVS
ncbi:MAG: O-antigen ligase family protein [Candidatus Omnitrophica bacterium]|nr:O-antigen ligase family protein [Candidatus Omnitrophota bacterium]